MGIFSDIEKGLKAGKEYYEAAIAEVKELKNSDEEAKEKAFGFGVKERHSCSYDKSNMDCQLSLADNVEYMKWLLLNGYEEKIKLIYIDPPFFTKANYNVTVSVEGSGKKKNIHHLAYNDMFDRNLEFYIENMTSRLLLMKDLLSKDGLIWVHLDWHSSHYIKLVLDEIFGEKHFVNEIIWKYKSGGSSKKHFARKHDSILVYGKTSKYYLDVPKEKSYNRNLKPYRFKGVKEYRDEYGWYTLVNMKDVWSIDMVGRTSSERNGYATQKPVELLKRIVRASTREGDICADFFCGSGSLLEAAYAEGRKWIGCDNEQLALSMARKRMDMNDSNFQYVSNKADMVKVGSLEMELTSSEELENGKRLLQLAVQNLEPSLDIGHIPLKERDFVKQAIEDDGIKLIDYIMIDPQYGDSFNAEMIVPDKFDDIRFISKGSVAVIAVDVFGKEYFLKMEL